jgi:hypothetical protein
VTGLLNAEGGSASEAALDTYKQVRRLLT